MLKYCTYVSEGVYSQKVWWSTEDQAKHIVCYFGVVCNTASPHFSLTNYPSSIAQCENWTHSICQNNLIVYFKSTYFIIIPPFSSAHHTRDVPADSSRRAAACPTCRPGARWRHTGPRPASRWAPASRPAPARPRWRSVPGSSPRTRLQPNNKFIMIHLYTRKNTPMGYNILIKWRKINSSGI